MNRALAEHCCVEAEVDASYDARTKVLTVNPGGSGGGGGGVAGGNLAAKIDGSATITHASGQKQTAFGSITVVPGDTIYVDTGEVKVTFPDGSKLVLMRGASWTLAKRSSAAVWFEQKLGEVYYSLKRAGGRAYEVKTGNVAVAVRGTAFHVVTRGTTTVVVCSGRVDVRARSGGKGTAVSVGQIGTFRTGAKPVVKGRAPYGWCQR